VQKRNDDDDYKDVSTVARRYSINLRISSTKDINFPRLGATFFERKLLHGPESLNNLKLITRLYRDHAIPALLNARDETSYPLHRETRGWISIEQSPSNRNGIAAATFRNDHQSCLPIEIALLGCLNSTNVCLALSRHIKEKSNVEYKKDRCTRRYQALSRLWMVETRYFCESRLRVSIGIKKNCQQHCRDQGKYSHGLVQWNEVKR